MLLSHCTSHGPGSAGLPSEKEFIAHKLKLLDSATGLTSAQKETAKANLLRVAGGKVPQGGVSTKGGLGSGMRYTGAFQQDFKTGTALQYDIIIQPKAGGNVSKHLFFTTTNRAKKGVEASIFYTNAAGPPKFAVFDWGRPAGENWQVIIPYADLKTKKYILKRSYKGKVYDVIRIRSLTYQVSSTDWQNDVYLRTSTGSWKQEYTYRYAATLADQQSHFWGPIFEVFQDSCTGTNVFGFLETSYASRQSGTGSWSPSSWTRLGTKEADFLPPSKGFQLDNLSPNYSWTAHAP